MQHGFARLAAATTTTLVALVALVSAPAYSLAKTPAAHSCNHATGLRLARGAAHLPGAASHRVAVISLRCVRSQQTLALIWRAGGTEGWLMASTRRGRTLRGATASAGSLLALTSSASSLVVVETVAADSHGCRHRLTPSYGWRGRVAKNTTLSSCSASNSTTGAGTRAATGGGAGATGTGGNTSHPTKPPSAAPIGRALPLPTPNQPAPVTATNPAPAPNSQFSPTLGGTFKPNFLAYTAGALPIIESLASELTESGWAGWHRDYVVFKLHIDNARTANLVQVQGYFMKPGPYRFNAPGRLDITAGPLTLKHTGAGNLWQVTSFNARPIQATMDYENRLAVRACNASGCTTTTITLVRPV